MEDWLSVAARERPGHTAVEAPDGSPTYEELDARADEAVRRLAALGVERGGRVATSLPPSAELCALVHAAPRIGAAIVPLNTRLPAEVQRRQAAIAGADVVVDRPLDGMEAAVEVHHEIDADAIHTVLFTSGTTGVPKRVELTAGNHDASAAASARAFGVEPDDRWLCALPLFHIAGLAILLRSARAATTVVLHDGFDAERVARLLGSGEVSLVSLVPTQLRRLREAGLNDAPGLRALLLGGGPIPPDLLEWALAARLPVRCTYGMTETTSQVAVTRSPEAAAAEPLEAVDLRIAEDGEILVRGAMVAPEAIAPDGWLHTGDRGHLDGRGLLRVEGRIKELIVTGGEKVAPATVEAVLATHPAVADAGVAGAPDPEWGEAVIAYVVERSPVSDYSLLAFCRERLAGYQVPKRVVRLPALPRNAAGKLLRSELSPPPEEASN